MKWIESDDRDVFLTALRGGNGDLYLTTRDSNGVMQSIRMCTSGGHIPKQIKDATMLMIEYFESLESEATDD
jgi:hypothetical protein